MSGAVVREECPRLLRCGCRCEMCAICGHWKHTAIHGPMFGETAGSKPWGHEFVPIEKPAVAQPPRSEA